MQLGLFLDQLISVFLQLVSLTLNMDLTRLWLLLLLTLMLEVFTCGILVLLINVLIHNIGYTGRIREERGLHLMLLLLLLLLKSLLLNQSLLLLLLLIQLLLLISSILSVLFLLLLLRLLLFNLLTLNSISFRVKLFRVIFQEHIVLVDSYLYVFKVADILVLK